AVSHFHLHVPGLLDHISPPTFSISSKISQASRTSFAQTFSCRPSFFISLKPCGVLIKAVLDGIGREDGLGAGKSLGKKGCG
ncbi:MAG: hypothetical protein WCG22_07575, partial [Lentisphaerota bacterium]